MDLRKLECDFFKKELLTSFTFEVDDTVCTPFFFSGGLNLLPNFQKGGDLTGPQFLEGELLGKRG